MQSPEVDFLQDWKMFCLQASMHALFSPENLQTGAVKG